MNSVFKAFLRKFVLVFFDDILVYSKGEQEHWVHLRQVLQILVDHQLYAKRSKCQFAVTKVGYLGHLISAEGVKANWKKIEAMLSLLIPKNPKSLRGFLGLMGYYRKFIKNYRMIVAPLTILLKINAFKWNEVVETAFNKLKRAVT